MRGSARCDENAVGASRIWEEGTWEIKVILRKLISFVWLWQGAWPQLVLPLTYRWIHVYRCSRLWLVYPQRYVPVCLGFDLCTCTRSCRLSSYIRLNAVEDHRTELLPWQWRVNGALAVRTTSVWFGRKSEFSWTSGGSGGSETINSKSVQQFWQTTPEVTSIDYTFIQTKTM